MSQSSALESSRRRLAEAADALAEFRLQAGLPPEPAAPSAAWRVPADASVRAALEAERERSRGLETALTAARLEASASAADVRALREAVGRGEAGAEASEALRVRAVQAELRAANLKERSTLLEAESVRLESLRRQAERAAADLDASGRAVAESLRRQLAAANAALDRAASETGAVGAQAKSETESLRSRLEAATARLQNYEREKRLEYARGTGDAAAIQTELERSRAVTAALRKELADARKELDEARGGGGRGPFGV